MDQLQHVLVGDVEIDEVAVMPRRWIVPIIPGPIDETVSVEVLQMDRVRVVYTVGHEERVLPVLPPMIACQVGQALQDASKYCGELRDAADAIASRRRLVKRHPGRAAVGPR